MQGLLAHTAVVLLDAGEPGPLEAIWREQTDLAQRSRTPGALLHSITSAIDKAVLDGELEASVESAAQMRRLGDELGAPVYGRQEGAWRGFRALLLLGRAEEALQRLPEAQQLAGIEAGSGIVAQVVRAMTALALAELGRTDDARPLQERLAAELAVRSEEHCGPTWILTLMLETAVLLSDRDLAALLAGRLAPAATDAFGHTAGTSVARQLGAAAALLGEREQAMRYYEQALEVCGRLRFRPELALTHLQYAELLLEEADSMNRVPTGTNLTPGPSPTRRGETTASGEHTSQLSSLSPRGGEDRREVRAQGPAVSRATALRHLNIAIPELQEMKMQPALDRARALLEQAGAPLASPSRAPAYPDGLSPREVEVLRLLAAGKSNQAIADALVISRNTAVRHVSNVFAKIGAANRAEAAGYAHRHGLV